jgi:hypothetical protein
MQGSNRKSRVRSGRRRRLLLVSSFGAVVVALALFFAEREALHGAKLVGMKVSEAVERLKELGVAAEWRAVTPQNSSVAEPDSISGFYVTGAVPAAPGKVIVFASLSPKS